MPAHTRSNSDKRRTVSKGEFRECPTRINARIAIYLAVHRIMNRQIEHLACTQSTHQLECISAQRDCYSLLGIGRNGMHRTDARQPTSPCRGTRIQWTERIEYLTTPVILIHIPIDSDEKSVGNTACRYLKTRIQLGEKIQRLTVYILACRVSKGQQHGVRLAFGERCGRRCLALKLHQAGARQQIVLVRSRNGSEK